MEGKNLFTHKKIIFQFKPTKSFLNGALREVFRHFPGGIRLLLKKQEEEEGYFIHISRVEVNCLLLL